MKSLDEGAPSFGFSDGGGFNGVCSSLGADVCLGGLCNY